MLIDPKRTVKATLICEPIDYGNLLPGQCIKTSNKIMHFVCPGCGQLAGVRCNDGGWYIEKGSIDDPTTLTLNPSILNSCCGWHGFLKNGVFESC